MIIIIDNYDSFTYNLYQYVGEINPDIEVYRNDRISVGKVAEIAPSHIIISPGPGFPRDAGISVELIRELGKSIPILGVCLGHQAIGEAYGGNVTHARQLVHGKTSEIMLSEDCRLFHLLPQKISAGRYHSLIVDGKNLPNELSITARTKEGEIMGLQHKHYHVYGIQFHPESVLTPDGKKILKNFLNIKGNAAA